MEKARSITISSTLLERGLFYLICIGIGIILCGSYFLPMIDVPQHAGQIEALHAIFLGSATSNWTQDVEINFFTPYWTAYLLGTLLSFVLPVNYAINTVIAIAFLLYAFTFSKLRKKCNAPPFVDWLALPVFFGFSYNLGLVTFLLAISIGFVLIERTLCYLNSLKRKFAIQIFLIVALLYFSHMLIFLFFCAIAASMILVDVRYPLKKKLKLLAPFYSLALFIPFFLISNDFFGRNGLASYFDGIENKFINPSLWSRVEILPLYIFPIDRVGYPISKNTYIFRSFLLILLLIAPLVVGYRSSKDLKKYIPLLTFFLVWFFCPSYFGRTAKVFERFGIFLIPFYGLILEKNCYTYAHWKKDAQTWLACITCVISIGLLKIPLENIATFNDSTQDFRKFVSQLPNGKKALGLVYNTPESLTYDRNIHYVHHFPSWYQALNHGWVDFNFAWFPPQVIRYLPQKIPQALPSFDHFLTQFIHFKHCDEYDLMLVYAYNPETFNLHEKLMKQSTCHHKLKYNEGKWFLYAPPD